MKNKIDKWKFWLDLNKNTFRAVELTAFFIAIIGLSKNLPLYFKPFTIIILLLVGLLIVMQLILGLRQILLDNKIYKEQQKQEQSKLKKKLENKISPAEKN